MCGALAAVGLGWGLWSCRSVARTLRHAIAVFGIAGLGCAWTLGPALHAGELVSAALLKRFGTADLDAVRQLADTYAKLCEARDAAQARRQRQVRRRRHLI